MTAEERQQHVKAEWLTVAAYIFALGGFVWSVNVQLGQITERLKELNTTVADEQRVLVRLVEHMGNVDKEISDNRERIKALEHRGKP